MGDEVGQCCQLSGAERNWSQMERLQKLAGGIDREVVDAGGHCCQLSGLRGTGASENLQKVDGHLIGEDAG